MTRQWLRLLIPAVFILLFLTSYAHSKLVTLVSVTPTRLVDGDYQTREITIEAYAPSGGLLDLQVLYWPQGSSPESSPEVFISSFTVQDDANEDREPKTGRIRTVLPKAFKKIGVYHILADRADGGITLIHEPKPSSWLSRLLALPRKLSDRLLKAAGSGFRGALTDRLTENPDTTSILTALMPVVAQQIDEKKLNLSIKSAMMPLWSPDGTLIACTAWRQRRWVIATYQFQADSELREIWQWISPNEGSDFSPVWAPEGRAIAFVHRTMELKSDVWILYLDPTGRPQREVQVTRLGGVQQIIGWDKMGILFEAEWEPKGLTRSTTQLWALEGATSQQETVPKLIPLSAPYGSLRGRAPARHSLIYAQEVFGEGGDRPISQLYEITDDGKIRRILGGERWSDRWPTVSPDGKWLAFDSNRPQAR